jgi:hypothetical protein
VIGVFNILFARFEEQNSQWEKRIKQKEQEKSEVEDRLDKVKIFLSPF